MGASPGGIKRNFIARIVLDNKTVLAYVDDVAQRDMEKPHMKTPRMVILESRKSDTVDWSTRNDRFSFADEVVNLKGGDQVRLERATRNAEDEMQRWQVAEPRSQFRIRAV